MKIFPQIIRTRFVHEIKELDQQLLLTKGREILLGRGLIETKSSDTKLSFRPRLMQHIAYNPFHFCFNSILEMRKGANGKLAMHYSVFHPLHAAIPMVLYLFLPLDLNEPIFYTPLFLIAINLSVVFFMQYPIFKRIIKQSSGSQT